MKFCSTIRKKDIEDKQQPRTKLCNGDGAHSKKHLILVFQKGRIWLII